MLTSSSSDAVNEEDVDKVWRQLMQVLNAGQPEEQTKTSLAQQPHEVRDGQLLMWSEPPAGKVAAPLHAGATPDMQQPMRSAVSLATNGKLQALKAMRLSASAQRQLTAGKQHRGSTVLSDNTQVQGSKGAKPSDMASRPGSAQSSLRQSWPANSSSHALTFVRQAQQKPSAPPSSAALKERYNLRRTGAADASELHWPQGEATQQQPSVGATTATQGGVGSLWGARRASGGMEDAAPQPRPRLTATPHKAPSAIVGRRSATAGGSSASTLHHTPQSLVSDRPNSLSLRRSTDHRVSTTAVAPRLVPGGAVASAAVSRTRTTDRGHAVRQSAPHLLPFQTTAAVQCSALDSPAGAVGADNASAMPSTKAPVAGLMPEVSEEPGAQEASAQEAGAAAVRPGSSSSVASYRSTSGSSGAVSDAGKMSLLLSLAGPSAAAGTAGAAEASSSSGASGGGAAPVPTQISLAAHHHRLQHNSSLLEAFHHNNMHAVAADQGRQGVDGRGANTASHFHSPSLQSHGFGSLGQAAAAGQGGVASAGPDAQPDPMCLAAASLLMDAFAAGVPHSAPPTPTLMLASTVTSSAMTTCLAHQAGAPQPCSASQQQQQQQQQLMAAFDPVASALLAAAAEAEAEAEAVKADVEAVAEPPAAPGQLSAAAAGPGLAAQRHSVAGEGVQQEAHSEERFQAELQRGTQEARAHQDVLDLFGALAEDEMQLQSWASAGPGVEPEAVAQGQQGLQRGQQQQEQLKDGEQSSAAQEEAEARAVALHQSSLLSRAMFALASRVEHKRRRRYAMEVATVWHRARLASCVLEAWWELAYATPRVYELQHAWDRRLVTSCLSAWHSAVPSRPSPVRDTDVDAHGLELTLNPHKPEHHHLAAVTGPQAPDTPAHAPGISGGPAPLQALVPAAGVVADAHDSSSALAAAKAAISAALNRAATALSTQAVQPPAPQQSSALASAPSQTGPAQSHAALAASPQPSKLGTAAPALARGPTSASPSPGRIVLPHHTAAPGPGAGQRQQQQRLAWQGSGGQERPRQQGPVSQPLRISRGKSLLTELERNVDWFAAATILSPEHSPLMPIHSSDVMSGMILMEAGEAGADAGPVPVQARFSQPHLPSHQGAGPAASPGHSMQSHRRSRSSSPSSNTHSLHDGGLGHPFEFEAGHAGTPAMSSHAGGAAGMGVWVGATALREVGTGSPPSWLVRSRSSSAPRRQRQVSSPAGSPLQRHPPQAMQAGRESVGLGGHSPGLRNPALSEPLFISHVRPSLHLGPLQAWAEADALVSGDMPGGNGGIEEGEEYVHWHDDSEHEGSDVSDPAGYRSYVVQPGSIVKVASGIEQPQEQGSVQEQGQEQGLGLQEAEHSAGWSDNPAFDEDGDTGEQRWLGLSGSEEWGAAVADEERHTSQQTEHLGYEHSGRNNPVFDQQSSGSASALSLPSDMGAVAWQQAQPAAPAAPLGPSQTTREAVVPSTPLYEALQQIMLM